MFCSLNNMVLNRLVLRLAVFFIPNFISYAGEYYMDISSLYCLTRLAGYFTPPFKVRGEKC